MLSPDFPYKNTYKNLKMFLDFNEIRIQSKAIILRVDITLSDLL